MARGPQKGKVCCCSMRISVALIILIVGVVLFFLGFWCLIAGLDRWGRYGLMNRNLVITGAVFLSIGGVITILGITFYCMINANRTREPATPVSYTVPVVGAYPQAYPDATAGSTVMIPGITTGYQGGVPGITTGYQGGVPGVAVVYPGAVPGTTIAYPGMVPGVTIGNSTVAHQSSTVFQGQPGQVETASNL